MLKNLHQNIKIMIKHFQILLKNSNEQLYIYGCICIVATLVCFILKNYSSVQISEVNAWIKPIKFFLSIAVFAFTMAVYVSLLQNQEQVNLYVWSFIIWLSIEVLLITYQSSRGKKSHFNIETPFDNLIYGIMGIAIFAIVIHTFYITILFFTQKEFTISPEMVLAIQLSFIMMVIFALEGFAMIPIFKHTVGGEDNSAGIPIVNWSKNFGDLRVAHFFGIHALQLIPILCYFLAKTKKEVIIICTLYFVFVTFTLIQALQGKPLIKL